MVINKEQAAVIVTYAAVIATTAAITWAFAKETFQREVQEQVAEVKAYYKKKADKEAYDKSDIKAYCEADVEATLKSYGQEQFTNEPIEARVIKEARLIEVSIDKEPGPGGGRIDRLIHPKSRPAIQVLSREDYYADSEDYPNQERVSATYYLADNVLLDQYDEVVDNAVNLVGDLKASINPEEPERIYVRNVTLKLDYEIDVDNGSYQTEVLGFEPPEKEARSPMRFRERD